MNIKNLIGNTTSVPSIDFNQVVKCDNLRFWRISRALWEKDKVELHIDFEKDGIQSSLNKNLNTIIEAVEYFYNFLKTL